MSAGSPNSPYPEVPVPKTLNDLIHRPTFLEARENGRRAIQIDVRREVDHVRVPIIAIDLLVGTILGHVAHLLASPASPTIPPMVLSRTAVAAAPTNTGTISLGVSRLRTVLAGLHLRQTILLSMTGLLAIFALDGRIAIA